MHQGPGKGEVTRPRPQVQSAILIPTPLSRERLGTRGECASKGLRTALRTCRGTGAGASASGKLKIILGIGATGRPGLAGFEVTLSCSLSFSSAFGTPQLRLCGRIRLRLRLLHAWLWSTSRRSNRSSSRCPCCASHWLLSATSAALFKLV